MLGDLGGMVQKDQKCLKLNKKGTIVVMKSALLSH